ncbi:MAG: hypothetical protein JWO36_3698 [Myxococcales bacterium]|nr:hypothetical protein [Myxococcales bacterium]
MTEFFATLRETFATLAAADRSLKRFGAAQHRYELAPPVADVAAIERALGATLPDDYRDYIMHVGAGGIGPYYGLLRADRAAVFAIDLPDSRALPICHLGCGYAALLALDGPARGQVWIQAQAMIQPIRPSFTVFLLDWIDRLSRAEWLDSFVSAGTCGLAGALSGYLDHCERARGLPSGALDGHALREDLALLGPAAIRLAAEGPASLFAPGDPVDPCLACVKLLDGMVERGLGRDVVAPGLPPLPTR